MFAVSAVSAVSAVCAEAAALTSEPSNRVEPVELLPVPCTLRPARTLRRPPLRRRIEPIEAEGPARPPRAQPVPCTRLLALGPVPCTLALVVGLLAPMVVPRPARHKVFRRRRPEEPNQQRGPPARTWVHMGVHGCMGAWVHGCMGACTHAPMHMHMHMHACICSEAYAERSTKLRDKHIAPANERLNGG